MKTLIVFILGLVAGPLLLVLAGLLGWLGSTGTGNPPGWEVSLGGRMVDAALERRSEGLKNPIAAGDSAALAAGRKLYAMAATAPRRRNATGAARASTRESRNSGRAMPPTSPPRRLMPRSTTAFAIPAWVHGSIS